MKHLGTFACEKVILDNRGAPSLITIMQNAHIDAIPGAQREQVPANAVIPKDWFIFSAWSPSAEDVGKEYEQITHVYWPNEQVFTETKTKFAVSREDDYQYNTILLMGFPIGQQGTLKITARIHHGGLPVTDLISFDLRIKHGPPPPPSPPPELQVSR
jgi:hypothetical protein